MRTLVAHCLAKDPADRPTPDQLVAYLRGDTGAIRPTSRGRAQGRAQGRLALAAVTAVALLGGAAYVMTQTDPGTPVAAPTAAPVIAQITPTKRAPRPSLSPVAAQPEAPAPTTEAPTERPGIVDKPRPSATPSPARRRARRRHRALRRLPRRRRGSRSRTPTRPPACAARGSRSSTSAGGRAAGPPPISCTNRRPASTAWSPCRRTSSRAPSRWAPCCACRRAPTATTGAATPPTPARSGSLAKNKCVVWGGGFAKATWQSGWTHCNWAAGPRRCRPPWRCRRCPGARP